MAREVEGEPGRVNIKEAKERGVFLGVVRRIKLRSNARLQQWVKDMKVTNWERPNGGQLNKFDWEVKTEIG